MEPEFMEPERDIVRRRTATLLRLVNAKSDDEGYERQIALEHGLSGGHAMPLWIVAVQTLAERGRIPEDVSLYLLDQFVDREVDDLIREDLEVIQLEAELGVVSGAMAASDPIEDDDDDPDPWNGDLSEEEDRLNEALEIRYGQIKAEYFDSIGEDLAARLLEEEPDEYRQRVKDGLETMERGWRAAQAARSSRAA